MNTEQTYHTPNVVQQRREEAAAINAAMNPAPALPAGVGINPAPYAGKMSDEQLGELGAKACGLYCYIGDNRTTAFARAVREAMDKEYEAELEKLKNEHTMEFIQLNHALPISRDGGLKIIDHAIATVNDLTAEVAKHDEEITRLTAEVQSLNESYRVAGRVVREVQAELVKANAELERLSWRSVEVKPHAQDADPQGRVDVCFGSGHFARKTVSAWPWEGHCVKMWRPFCPPPAPIAEEVERERFEIWAATSSFGHDLTRMPCGKYYNSVLTSEAWELWQAARAAKEGEK